MTQDHAERQAKIADQLNDLATFLRRAADSADSVAANLRSIDPDDPFGSNAALDPKHLYAEAVNLAARTTRESKSRAEQLAARATSGQDALSINKTARLLGVSVNTLRKKLPSKAAASPRAAAAPDPF